MTYADLMLLRDSMLKSKPPQPSEIQALERFITETEVGAGFYQEWTANEVNPESK